MVLLLDDSTSDHGPLIRNISIAMTVLAGLAVLLRFYARRLARQPVSWDDWLMLMALPCSWALSIDIILCVNFGKLGQHITGATANSTIVFGKYIFATQFFYAFTITFIKFSIVAFHRRIFWVYMTKIRSRIFFALIGSWLIASVFAKIFICSPVDGFWFRNTNPPPRCLNNFNMYIGLTIPNIIIDVFLLIFPLPPVWRLQVPTAQKLELTCMFAVAGFILILSSLRLVAVVQSRSGEDLTWDSTPIAIFEVLEPAVAILLASIPSMVPMFRIVWGRPRRTGRESLGVYSPSTWIVDDVNTSRPAQSDGNRNNEVGDEEVVFDHSVARTSSSTKEKDFRSPG